MISIQTGKIRNTVSQLDSQYAVLVQMQQQVETEAAQVKTQSYTADTRRRLAQIETQFEEIGAAIQQLSEALEQICGIAEQTESRVVEIYEGGIHESRTFTVQRSRVNLNRNLRSIARISL